jgi:hypothetical protein
MGDPVGVDLLDGRPQRYLEREAGYHDAMTLRALDVFIGRWIIQGATEAAPGEAAVPIARSDVYEWAAGGRFVLHTAYGLIGGVTVGAHRDDRL